MLTAAPARSRFLSFVALTKPRIVELLLITTVPTMIVAAQGWPRVELMVATVVGGALAAGGANAYNMYIDRDIDAVMNRTKNRPLVTGDVLPNEALIFASVLEAAAFAWLWYTVNLLSAVLAVSACAFYVFIYTMWLKRTSTQNIVIGGAAGAVPVLVGWSSVTNTVGWEAVVLFAIIFFWTPPHFWALAIKYEKDYSAASVPMMPVVEGHKKTALQMLVYSLIVWALTLVFWHMANMGWIYFVAAMIVGAYFSFGAMRLFLEADPTKQQKQAIAYFTFSITHLSVIFCVMAIDQLIGWGAW